MPKLPGINHVDAVRALGRAGFRIAQGRYNTHMTVEQLRAVYQARPFRPFTLHLADGENLHVPHTDFVSHSPNGRTLIVYAEDDQFSIVDLLLVTRLEVHNGAATASGGDK